MSDDDEKMKGLFDDDDSDGEPAAPSSAATAFQRAGLESDDDEQPAPSPAHDDFRADDADEEPTGPQRPKLDPERWEIDLCTRPRQHLQVVNFKSLLSIESQPYKAETFQLDSVETKDEMGRRRMKASALNRIRWRFTGEVNPETGQLERESNARFVRWSDGSLQIHIGDDVLDVNEQDIDDQNLTLCVYHEACKVLQAQAQIKTRFLLKPHGLASRLHRNLAYSLAPSAKTAKVKLDASIKDYERESQLAAQAEEARLKLEKKQEKVMRRSAKNYSAFGALGRKSRGAGLTAEALEAHDSDYDDEEGGEAPAGGSRMRYDEGEEEAREKRLLAAKRETPGSLSRKRRLLDDDDDFDTQLSDDDPADMPAPAPSKGNKQRFILDDDESD